MFLAMYAGSMHAGHAMHGAGAPAGGAGEAMSGAALVGSWALMVVAMMLPLARKRARWLAFRSLRARRQHAVAVFTLAFLAVWVAAGVVAIALLAPVRGEPVAVAVALALAACWHRAPARRRLLARCGVLRAPAVRGVRAVGDWARGGARVGARCVGTCGALMLPMAIVHHPALMVGAALVLVSERRPGPNPERRAGRRLEALWLGARGPRRRRASPSRPDPRPRVERLAAGLWTGVGWSDRAPVRTFDDSTAGGHARRRRRPVEHVRALTPRGSDALDSEGCRPGPMSSRSRPVPRRVR